MVFKLDLIQTLALAVFILIIGDLLRKKIKLLDHFCIPAPVVGGILFSLISLLGYTSKTFTFEFDETLKDVFLIGFFTTIGFTASLRLLKKGGIQAFIFLLVSIVLVIVQNVLGIGLAKLFNLHPYIGLATGSTPLVGGPGTSGAFGPLFEQAGVKGAATIAMAAATFGLVMGSLTGGPIGKALIDRNKLAGKNEKDCQDETVIDKLINLDSDSLLKSAIIIVVAMGIGTIISKWFVDIGLTFPPYIGGMLAAAIIRNIYDFTNKELVLEEIESLGNICLAFFLSMALMSLKLWQLADLALPMMVILLAQVALMSLFAYFVVFRIMGKDYDAAIIASGTCGFGLGATANAMANMETLTEKYNKSAPRAFFAVPLVGSLFIDFFNAFAITFFMNIFK
ncbi:sodium/glutamate symporter [Clostridium oryzae]|uniref:Sodium/glutamate symporter n=1 Tax=Clostridium oryzae TaxID=1450648 RepID=A0A1V4ISM7_9CLOT|nr:sodium/glutamate symporter [Clostridium oryzae]OPJ62899.1 sodium/glutamate symport carrier protein [Clostridium oryzae]